MKVLCNKTTTKIEGFLRKGNFDYNPDTHIVINIGHTPSIDNERLNGTEDDIRFATQAELDIDADEKLDFANIDPFLKAFVLSMNDGSFVLGNNYTPAEMKVIIKAKLNA